MKWSKFNIIKETKSGKFIIYNYAENNVLILLPELYKIISSSFNGKKNVDEIKNIHPELYKTLEEKRFIIENKENEAEYIKNKIINNLTSNDTIFLTINPTLDCNLRCWYCYEKHTKGGYMTSIMKESVLKFIENAITKEKIRIVRLSFFGGEPLMKANKNALPLLKKNSKYMFKTQ